MKFFFDQTYAKSQFMYENIDVRTEPMAFNRAFYNLNFAKDWFTMTGENYDYSVAQLGSVEN